MLKVVFDSNIYVSALTGGTICRELLKKSMSGEILRLFVSLPILEELKEILERFGFSQRETTKTLRHIIRKAELVKITQVVRISPDPDDNMILECALSAKAGYIISGDKHLLTIRRFKGIKIISPGEFADNLTRA